MGLLQLNLALSSSTSSLSLFPDNHQTFSRTGHKNQFFGLTRRARLATSRIRCSAKVDNGSVVVKDKSVSVILLAGGRGKRMGANMPKQYLPLLGQPIALYSFYTFSRMVEVKEIVVVCDPSYSDIFEETKEKINVDLKFSLPGKERQDSVYSGLQEVDFNSELVCIHDSARPLVLSKDVQKVLMDALRVGAAVLGVPAKATIKEVHISLCTCTIWDLIRLFTSLSYSS
ncbi:hypothetical protein CISIN_1g022657mg [Citrus sinensis]|uniref:2-C-methyl-D-erythritol 4-phosphate cytidylyltransferase n=1 Tax=Citrus sinensis TaxID=2711 RepID=A0A067DED9_CITSI|nr:hypothetical protein CISIN_1g022657mg [Citrus sinensis]